MLPGEGLCAVYLVVLKRSSRDRDSRKAQRKPYKYWDVAPIGYENMTPMQYKALQGQYTCDWQSAYLFVHLQFKLSFDFREQLTCG